ncbi:unnamed protein product [Blepharisma stoltei]|uniref:Uncharacterized protein n=1 Tax=Blepharisma stoltei TaxID=1481888 RepID=A0AAU9JXS0_9CILI|nr:unnamed protein product [Blepharisma stoltei]
MKNGFKKFSIKKSFFFKELQFPEILGNELIRNFNENTDLYFQFVKGSYLYVYKIRKLICKDCLHLLRFFDSLVRVLLYVSVRIFDIKMRIGIQFS